jgi:RNA polymerase sigma-70 factor (ECF subfamily)
MNDTKRFDVIGLLGLLRRYARSLTRDEGQAEDLVQDTLVRAYERRGSFRSDGNLRGWLLSILHNTFIDGRRRHMAEVRRLEQVAALADAAAPADQEFRVRLLQIEDAFMRLPHDQRAALHLVAIEGLPYQQAALALGDPGRDPHVPAGPGPCRPARARGRKPPVATIRNEAAQSPRRRRIRCLIQSPKPTSSPMWMTSSTPRGGSKSRSILPTIRKQRRGSWPI